MSKAGLFINLIRSDFKRLKKYLPSLFISVILILTFLSAAGIYISKNIYKTNTYETVRIAYYLDEDGDERYINFAVDYLSTMKSMRETSNIIEVNSIEEGYDLLDKKEVLFFIYLPAGFYEGIMTGHNPVVNLVVRDNDSIAAYITNELFLSLGRYLTVAQAAIYSAIDTSWVHEMSDDEVARVNNLSNKVFFEKVAAKESVINVVEATSENNYPIKKHYEAAAIMLSLFFMAFILIPYMQSRSAGTIHKLKLMHIGNLHIFISNLLTAAVSLYLVYIPCYIAISFLNEHIHIAGLITVIPAISVIAVIVALAGSLSKSAFSGNLILLFTAITIAYIGGAIIPAAMLPKVVQSLSGYMPGRYILDHIAYSLFG